MQQSRACSIPLSKGDIKSKWVVYLQYYRKDPLWHIVCGKSTNLSGAQSRLDDYVNERSTMPQSVKDILQRCYERMSHTILAAVDIPFEGVDREYVTALVTWQECTSLCPLSYSTYNSSMQISWLEELPFPLSSDNHHVRL